MNAQYKKGVLDLCVLSLLEERDRYGYEIADTLSDYIELADGTVYPLLRKLKSDGLLTTYLQEESGGPPRKYYSLTRLGRETYEKEKAEYLQFAKEIERLLGGVRNMTKNEFISKLAVFADAGILCPIVHVGFPVFQGLFQQQQQALC